MRAIRRCALLVPLLSVDPTQAGRTSTSFDVTATVVTACRSIGTPSTWTRAAGSGDPTRWVTVDCGTDTGFRIRGPWPSPLTLSPALTPAPVPAGTSDAGSAGTSDVAAPSEAAPSAEAEGVITVTVEF